MDEEEWVNQARHGRRRWDLERPSFMDYAREFMMGELPPEHQRIVSAWWWRIIVRASFLLFVLWSLGYIIPLGPSHGFSRAGETQALVRVIEIGLEREMRKEMEAFCSSTPRSSDRRVIERNMRELQRQFKILTGSYFKVSECDQL